MSEENFEGNNELVEVPDFTRNDFLNTTNPYLFLYKFWNNKFILEQMVQKVGLQAEKVGVKRFASLWKNYRTSNIKDYNKAVIIESNFTEFENQELELFSDKYICDEHGVATFDKQNNPQVICRHPIMPVQRLVNIDNGEERLKIAYQKGYVWRSVIVEKSVLASSSSILQLAANGIMVNSENAKALSTYLLEMEQFNYDVIPEQKSVSRLGWVGDHGFSPYVKGLAFDGENNFKHIFNAVKCEGNYQKWLEIMLELRKEKAPGRLFLAASFASAILEPCGLLPFFLHAWGGTEVGKTVGLMIATSVWGCPKMGEYITTFNSTLVGQEMTASFLNSLPMCIDELQIQSSAGVKDFDKIIYQLTEGVGKTRGAKAGGLQKTNTWKNCFITNGEHPISNSNSGGGAVNRIIEFECATKVYSDLVGICAVIQANYGYAGREFVEYLQSDGAFERVNQLQKEYYRELIKCDSTEKQAASASAILAADHIATELIFKDGNNLTVKDITGIMTKKNDVNVNLRAYDYILELVASNPNKFVVSGLGNYQGEVWGKIDRDNIYIIKSVFDREMSAQGFNATAFLAWAKRMSLLVTDTDRKTKRARVAGSLANCICILDKQEEIKHDFEIIDDDLDF